jgi:transcription termination factor Rho
MASELNEMHLADLHERAAASGIDGYRRMRREELVAAIAGSGDSEAATETEERPRRRSLRPRRGGRRRPSESREREREPSAPAKDETETDEADTDELVITATVLDDSKDEPVELGPGDAEGGDEREAETATEEVRGVLELTRQRYGFLRLGGLTQTNEDIYISAAQVRRCELRPGDEVAGPAREPRRGERHRALVHVDTVNGEEPQVADGRPDFDALAPIQPERRIKLESSDEVLLRAADLLAPFAYGQRILVHAAPRSGRTTLLRAFVRAAAAADDNTRVVVLLLDERPEESTTWREAIPTAEFAIATGDLAPAEQVRTAELALERARRLSESGLDAILVCDSLSRLAVAAGDVTEVKRLFGSGRNLSGGGSLTVIATVLDDGRDEGETQRAVGTTESSTIVHDPDLAAVGVTPAISVPGTRVSNEEAIRDADELEAVRKLRGALADLDPTQAADFLRERIESSSSNAELLSRL